MHSIRAIVLAAAVASFVMLPALSKAQEKAATATPPAKTEQAAKPAQPAQAKSAKSAKPAKRATVTKKPAGKKPMAEAAAKPAAPAASTAPAASQPAAKPAPKQQ